MAVRLIYSPHFKIMERKIELKLVDNNHYWMKGIYLIRIGRMRYIGKALVVGNRVYQHQSVINRTMANYAEMVNLQNDFSKNGTNIRIAKYLLENPLITEGTVEVIERQVCSNALYYSENSYLKDIRGNRDFYNWSHYGARPREDEDNLWEVEESGGVLNFFDPRMKHLMVKSNRKPAENKQVIGKINEVKQSRPYKMERLNKWRESALGANPTLEMRKVVVDYCMREISKM